MRGGPIGTFGNNKSPPERPGSTLIGPRGLRAGDLDYRELEKANEEEKEKREENKGKERERERERERGSGEEGKKSEEDRCVALDAAKRGRDLRAAVSAGGGNLATSAAPH